MKGARSRDTAAASQVDGSHVYWTNWNLGSIGTGTIGRADLNGSSVDQSFITGASDPQGVAVDGSHVYWTNGSGKGFSVGRSNLDGTSVDQTFISLASPAEGIAVDSFPHPTTTTVECKPGNPQLSARKGDVHRDRHRQQRA